MCDTSSSQGDEVVAGGTECAERAFGNTRADRVIGNTLSAFGPGALHFHSACGPELMEGCVDVGELEDRSHVKDRKVALPPPSLQVSAGFRGAELESPQGPLEFCAQEVGGDGAVVLKEKGDVSLTGLVSKTLENKPAWDMDTLKRAVAAAKTGVGEVARVVEGCTFKPREQAFTALINMCGQVRDWRKAVEVFEAMKRVRGVRPNTYTYSALIAACSNAGEWQRALELFQVMELAAKCDPNCEPNEVTYSSLITACERGGVYDKALEVYDAMLKVGIPGDHISFSSALSACEKSGNMARAKEILQDMHNRGFVASQTIYKEIMLDYAENGDWDRALDMCLTMQMVGQDPNEGSRKRRGRKKQGPLATQQGPCPVHRGFPKPGSRFVDRGDTGGNPVTSGPPWDMETLKRAIVLAGLGSGEVRRVIENCTFRPREQAFTALINLCGRLRDWKKAVEVFNAMKQTKGVRPNTYTYSALIAACSSAGEWEKALEVFERMKLAAKTDSNCTPNEVTYSALITACQRGGMFNKALELYDETLRAGVPVDQITFSSALAACEKSERWDKAEEILKDMHARGLTGSPSVYSELIHNRAETGEWNRALNVFMGMRLAGADPDSNTCKALMMALEKGGQPEMVMELFHLLRQSSMVLDTDIYNMAMTATAQIDVKRMAGGFVTCPAHTLRFNSGCKMNHTLLNPAACCPNIEPTGQRKYPSYYWPSVPKMRPKKGGTHMAGQQKPLKATQFDTQQRQHTLSSHTFSCGSFALPWDSGFGIQPFRGGANARRVNPSMGHQ